MELGTETGSVINHLMTSSKQKTPEVGMGATICQWSDRSAGTIVKVWTDKGGSQWVEVQGDKATRTDENGMSDCQHYEYERNPNAPISTWRKRKGDRERWVRMEPGAGTRWRMQRGPGLLIGTRDKYHDYTF